MISPHRASIDNHSNGQVFSMGSLKGRDLRTRGQMVATSPDNTAETGGHNAHSGTRDANMQFFASQRYTSPLLKNNLVTGARQDIKSDANGQSLNRATDERNYFSK